MSQPPTGDSRVKEGILTLVQDVPRSGGARASGPEDADAPLVRGRFWADLEDSSSDEGGPGAPDGGPGPPPEDVAAARELLMLQWIRGPSPPGAFEAACHKVELVALRLQRDKGMDASSPECVEVRRHLFVKLAMIHDMAPGWRRFLDLDGAYHGTRAARASAAVSSPWTSRHRAPAATPRPTRCRPRA